MAKELELMVTKLIDVDMHGKRDLCALYSNTEVFGQVVSVLADRLEGKADYIASPESMGFILGSSLARALGIGFIPIRNANIYHLEAEQSIRSSYIDHHDNVRSLRIRKTDALKGKRIVIVDDWIGTSATLQACMTILEESEAAMAGVASIGIDHNASTDKMLEDGLLQCIIK